MRRGPLGTLLHHLHRLTGPGPDPDGASRLLLERFVANRDQAAFAELVRRYGPLVWGVCRRVLGHEHDAEDSFQATFLVLARRAGALRDRAALGGWLQRVAWRIAAQAKADTARRQLREAQAPLRSASDTTGEAQRRELGALLHEELSRLPEKHRSPLVLCYLEGRTHQEAARALGCPPGTMSRRVGQALDLLRLRLNRRGVGLPVAALAAALTENAGAAASALLVQSTVRVALLCAAGETAAAEAAAATAAALAGCALRTMWLAKVRAIAAVLLVGGLLGGGAGVLLQRSLAEKPAEGEQPSAPQRPAQAPAQAARTDAHGDPLPAGAVFRFGSARWRHGADITNSALSPDGKRLATVAKDSVVVWDLNGGKRLHEFRCTHGPQYSLPGLAFSPDGKRLGHVRGYSFAAVWDVETGREVWRHDGEKQFASALCHFTLDGTELVVGGNEATYYWDLEKKQGTRWLPVKGIRLLSPDATTYVRIEERKAIILGDVRTGKETNRLEVSAVYNGIENGIAFTPDGRSLAVVDRGKEVQVRDLAGGRVRAAFPLPEAAARGQPDRSSAGVRVGFTADGRTLLLATEDGRIHRWDLATGKELPALARHYGLYANSQPPSFHGLPDGRTLVSAGADGLIRRWDLQTGRELSRPEGYMGRTYAAYAADGRFAAVGDGRGRVDLWDATTGKLLRTFREEGPAVTRMALAPDGKTLAVAQAPAAVVLYEVPSGKEGRVFQYEEDERPWVLELWFSPDGRSLCVCPHSSGMRLWDVATGNLRWRGGQPYCAAFTPDGTRLVVEAEAHLRYLDAATGEERGKARLNTGRGEGVRPHMDAIAFAPDGRHLAVTLWDGNLFILDARTGAELKRVMAVDNSRQDPHFLRVGGGHRAQSLAFSPDGKWLVSGGTESVLRVWEAATAAEVLRLDGHGSSLSGVSAVAFSPDGHSCFSCGADAQAYLWSLKPPPAADRGLEALWAALDADPATAYRAVWALSADPAAAAFLRAKIAPRIGPEKARLAKHIADLASETFAVREAASRALAELGELAVPALEEALKAKPSLEMRQRLDRLLSDFRQDSSPADLRRQRAVQALELAGTADARTALRAWAGGAANARLTEDAKAALARWERRR